MSSYSTKAKKVDGKLEKLAKKRVPVNPKYAHVKSTLNTGASLTKYLEKLEEIRSNYRFQKNEIFKRMKVTTFAQLVVQVERYKQARDPLFGDILEEEEGSTTPTDLNSNENTTNSRSNGKTENSSDYKSKPPPTNDNRVPSPTLTESDFGDQPGTQRSTLQGLIFGVGEKDAEKNETDSVYQSNRSSISSRNSSTAGYGQNTDSEAAPYLLLDCQDEEDFEKCHIVGAINFPKSRLSRAVNYEISPMFDYKNKPGKVIVVYDADEQVAIQVGSIQDMELAEYLAEHLFSLCDSIGFGEDNFLVLNHAIRGPHLEVKVGASIAVAGGVGIVNDIVLHIFATYGQARAGAPSRLSRVFFSSYAFQVTALIPNKWSNVLTSVSKASQKVASVACPNNFQLAEGRLAMPTYFTLSRSDSAIVANVDVYNPITQWRRKDVDLHIVPVLLCNQPKRSTDIGIAASAEALKFIHLKKG